MTPPPFVTPPPFDPSAFFLIAVASLCLTGFQVNAGSLDDSSNNENLGSRVSMEYALKKSSWIGLGHFLSTGTATEPEGVEIVGQKGFEGAKISIDKFLMGHLASQVIEAQYDIQTYKTNEHAPTKDGRYIFFLQKRYPDRVYILKIAPASENNLAEVSKMISVTDGHP
jgi:hypothetical protein